MPRPGLNGLFREQCEKKLGLQQLLHTVRQKKNRIIYYYFLLFMAEKERFACILIPLAGNAESKQRYSPVSALAHAQATGLCGHDSNLSVVKQKTQP